MSEGEDYSDLDPSTFKFECRHQDDLIPTVSPEVDAVYKRARAMQKANVERDPKIDEEVLRLYRDTARVGHGKAMNNLAYAYMHGKGVEVNYDQAIYWMDKMIEADIGAGYYGMARPHQARRRAPEQKLGIWAYYRRSADRGYPTGQYEVGRKFVGKFNQTPVAAQAVATGLKMLRCSLEQGFAPAGEKLGFRYHNEGNYPAIGLLLSTCRSAGMWSKPLSSLWRVYWRRFRTRQPLQEPRTGKRLLWLAKTSPRRLQRKISKHR